MRIALLLASLLVAFSTPDFSVATVPWKFQIRVEAGKYDRENVPVVFSASVGVDDPDSKRNGPPKSVKITTEDGTVVASQFNDSLRYAVRLPGMPRVAYPSAPAVATTRRADGKGDPPLVRTEAVAIHPGSVRFNVPKLSAGKTATFNVELQSTEQAIKGFSWHDTPGDHAELRHGDRPVLRYMYKTYDGSTKKSHELTKKIFHHVYDPSGKQLLTKGPGGLYPHHRALYFGFSRCTHGNNQQADTWHCAKGERQTHEKFLAVAAGPVYGSHLLAVDWHGRDGKVFAQEMRELTVYDMPGGTLIEFASRLNTAGGTVRLDGDPQHAGFQFRAAQEVAAKTKAQTYYLRPDGKGALGKTRNWKHNSRDSEMNKLTSNLPFNAMSFVVGGQRYTVVYLDHPNNPKEARYSERDYGRFGSYFQYELDDKKPALEVRYRIWIQEGEMTVEDCWRLSHDFVSPPKVTVVSQRGLRPQPK